MLSASEREYLRQIPLFASLDEETLAQVGAATSVRHYDRGEVIAVEGERRGSLRYVRTGLVKLATTSAEGREQVLRLVRAGQTFNLVAALDSQPSAATATALDLTTIYAVRREVVHRLLAERPAVAQAALQALAADTREMIALARDLALYHVSERVARLLLDQERCACDRCRNHYMTQQEMAAIVGTAREMVGRTLHEFQAAGIIDLHNGHVIVRDRERLSVVAREQANARSHTRQHPAASEHSKDDHALPPRAAVHTRRHATDAEPREHAAD
ncbi:MAG TPA: Crp/Fnr family transcriptional regulator [Ktedonobacterales bacterium]|jgi:CRP/FNR family transcriptional regulator|nr:Crp/Fnr family transcriptional regulator [Ktedonobacterales bacterium]